MWALMTLGQDELDMNPAGGSPYAPFVMGSREAALEKFDEDVKQARALLAASSDEAMMGTWTLKTPVRLSWRCRVSPS